MATGDQGEGDPFARIRAAKDLSPSDANGVRASGPAGDHVCPIPADAPPRPASFKGKGEPSAVWTYRNADGTPLGFVARFDAGGGKEVLPLTLWREKGQLRWRWKAAPEPRPLYGLERLAARPLSAVLLVEGEKAADAGQDLFPEMAVVTWSGGSKASGKADWSPLVGRAVIIWPDHDKAGADAAAAVARHVSAVGAAQVGTVRLPAYFPEGWDLADPMPSGFDRAQAAALIDEAAMQGVAGGVTLPYGFRLDHEGLWQDATTKDGKTHSIKISAPFEPIGEARDPDGSGWSIVVRFKDRDGRSKTEIIPRGTLVSEPGAVRSRLASQGLMIKPAKGQGDRFTACLGEMECSRRITLAHSTGWAPGNRFVLPSRTIGPAGGEPVMFTGDPAGFPHGTHGTMEGWRQEVAARAPGNSLLLLALSIGFAGPLLRPLGLEGGGFHFRGLSSMGKSTLGRAAASVWCGGNGALGGAQSWRATDNALEAVAQGHSETVLVLDEINEIMPDRVGNAAYALASGQGKARASTSGQLRRRAEWLVLSVSTGEISLAEHIRSSAKGGRVMAGQELRLLDIPADAGKGLGIWETLHGFDDPALLSEAINAGTREHYGHAGPAFVERFVLDPKGSAALARDIMRSFVEASKEHDDNGQVHRAANRFALAAAAGELATLFGIVPWREGEAALACRSAFQRWANAFGRSAPREQRAVLLALKAAIQQQGSRFGSRSEGDRTEWGVDPDEGVEGHRTGEARSLNALGLRYVTAAKEVFYLFYPQGWEEVLRDVTGGVDAARMVYAAGHLEKGDGKHWAKKKKINGVAQRLYWVRSSILEADFDE
jgi:putative DNA primase/helicase